jgi:glutathione synthase/RimK-type ligase-like ATP-grasp enzyme
VTENTSAVEHPGLLGFAGLMRLVASGTQIPDLGPQLEARAERDPQDANALLDLATLLFLMLNTDYRRFAFEMQDRALKIRRVYRLPAGVAPPALRLLVLMAAGDMTANTPVDCLLQESDVAVTLAYVLPGEALPRPLPAHDLVMVAIGESEQNQILLQQLDVLTRLTDRPVVNLPARIRLLTRDHVAAQLRGVPGIEMPATARVDRTALERAARGEATLDSLVNGGRYPVILRPLGSHGGKDLVKVDDAAALAGYLENLADGEFYLSNFIDYSGGDGLFRKYRVVMIAGRPYACHLAISSHWMIHYVNADMDASAAKRAEEQHFMESFEHGFARRHGTALAAIQGAIAMDYFGIDCAETRDGKLLIFEADSAMIVHATDDPEVFPYKLPHMRKLFAAFRDMLAAKCNR